MAWIGTDWEERIQPDVDDTFLGEPALCKICESHSNEERMKFKQKVKLLLKILH